MWWWNKDVDVAECRKTELFRIWRQSQNEEDRKKYCEAKKDAKRVYIHGYGSESQRDREKVDLCSDGRELFRIAKQRIGEKKDVVRISCFKNESGVKKVSVDDLKSGRSIWKR